MGIRKKYSASSSFKNGVFSPDTLTLITCVIPCVYSNRFIIHFFLLPSIEKNLIGLPSSYSRIIHLSGNQVRGKVGLSMVQSVTHPKQISHTKLFHILSSLQLTSLSNAIMKIASSGLFLYFFRKILY